MTYFDWGVVLGQDVILDLALYKFGIFIYLFIAEALAKWQ